MTVSLLIIDDGGAGPIGGTGLRGLADRIDALDGHLTLDSPPGRGTHIHAHIVAGNGLAQHRAPDRDVDRLANRGVAAEVTVG